MRVSAIPVDSGVGGSPEQPVEAPTPCARWRQLGSQVKARAAVQLARLWNAQVQDLCTTYLATIEGGDEAIANNEHYTQPNILRREMLKFSAPVRAQLDALWAAIDTNGDGQVDEVALSLAR